MNTAPKRQARPRLLTIPDVAADLAVSVKTVRRLIDRGDLRVCRVLGSVRIADEELAMYLARASRNDRS